MATPAPASDRNRTRTRLRQSVLIAVEPPSLQRLIQHVLHGDEGLRVIAGVSTSFSQGHFAQHPAPDVIVVNHRLQRQRGDVVEDLKRSCPAATLILLTPTFDEPSPPRDTFICLPEEAIVKSLLPMIHQATRSAADRTPTPAPQAPAPRSPRS